MRLDARHPLWILAFGNLLAFGCGKESAPTTGQRATDVTVATASDASPKASEDVSKPAEPAVLVLARIKDREIRSTEVEARLALVHKAGTPLEFSTLREVVDDLIDESLLAEDARAAGFGAPAGVNDDAALAEAYAKSKFTEAAKAEVGEAQVTAWFAERRGIARIVVRTAEQARDVLTSLKTAFDSAPDKRRESFLEVKAKVGRKGEDVPDGVLVDIEGRNELGEALVPAEVGKALFALTEDGAVSEPVQVGESFVLVQRLGVRPATPLEGVPADQRQLAMDKLVAARALSMTDEHLARLRRDHGVALDDAQLDALGQRLNATKSSKLKRLPFGARKIVMQRMKNAPETRSPALVPPGAHAVEKATYDQIKDKMEPREPKSPSQDGTP